MNNTRVMVLWTTNKGLSAVINNTIQSANGIFNHLPDADDRIVPDYIRNAIDFLENMHTAGFVCGR